MPNISEYISVRLDTFEIMANTTPTPRKKKSIIGRIFMWTGITIVLILALLIATPFIFKNKLVELAKTEANKQLNAKVDFGDFGLNLFSSFPDFRFNIENVSVVGVNEFEGDSLLALKKLSLDLNLMSVIKGENYQINAVKLENPRINVQVLKDGKASYDIVKPSTDTTKVVEESEPAKFNLRLSSLIIEDAYLVYNDEEGGMKAQIADLDYELNGSFSDDILHSKNDLQIEKTTFGMGGINYLSETKIKAKGDLDVDLNINKYTAKDFEIFLNELGLSLNGFLTMGEKDMDMDLALKTIKGDFKSILSLIPVVFTKDFEDVQASGTVALSAAAKGIYNEVRYPAFNLELLVENGSFKYPALPKSVEKIFIDAKVANPNGNLDATVIDVNKLNLVMGGNPINAFAHVKTPISDPAFDFGAVGTINLGSIKEFIPLEKNEELSGVIKADVAVKGRMSQVEREQYELLTARGSVEANSMKLKLESLPYEVLLNAIKLNFTNKFVELSSFSAKMGKSDIRATGRIDNFLAYIFRDELIKGNFTVNSDLLDINQLTSSNSTSTATAETKPAEAKPASTENSVIEIPDNIDFELTTNLRKVLYDNLSLDNITGKAIMRQERLTLQDLKANTLGGQMRISGFYDSKNTKAPDVNLNFIVDNFDFVTTFKTFNTVQKMAPIAQYARGTFSVSLENFVGKLNQNMEPDLNTISANGVLKTKNVGIGGYGPFEKLGDALKIPQLKSMSFQNVNFSYKIKDGRAIISPFDVNIDKVKATISGSHGFDRTIDYTWRMQIPRSLFGTQANSTINGLISQANSAVGTNFTPGDVIYVDVIFGGTDTKPTIKTSIKEGLKSTLNEVKEQVVEVVKEKVSEQVDKIMEEARKQSDKILADAKVLADKTKSEGYAAADKLVSDVKNPLAKLAAQESMKLAKKETDKKVQKILDDAKVKSDKVLKDAQAKSDAQLKK